CLLTRVDFDGRYAYPLLDAWVATKAEEYWRTSRRKPHDTQMSRAAIQLWKLYGLMPIGDGPRDPINWWLHTDFDTKKYWFGEPWGGPDTEIGRSKGFVDVQHELIAEAARVASAPSESAIGFLGTTASTESHVPIIAALAGGPANVFQVNIPNQNTIEGIASDVVVEVPVRIDSEGLHRLPVEQLPRKIMLEQILPR